jgi:hypothetical protein
VAFIDSGIDAKLFTDWNIMQFATEQNHVIKEAPHDHIGHGTSMMAVFINNVNHNRPKFR